MRRFLFLVSVAIIFISCDKQDPIENAEESQLITQAPPNFLAHWCGKGGVLELFGDGSEIGAIIQYDFKRDRKFVLFDGEGTSFINDVNGIMSGPHSVSDLFKVCDIWGTKDDSIGNGLALTLLAEGVESAAFTRLPADNATAITFITKAGNAYNLWKWNNSQSWEIKNRDYGIASHSSLGGVLKAMLAEDPIPGVFYQHAKLIDNTGENIQTGEGEVLGKVTDYWPKCPSKKIEAMCFMRDQDIYETYIRVLGEDKEISNGQFLYVSVKDIQDSVWTESLVDLKKDY